MIRSKVLSVVVMALTLPLAGCSVPIDGQIGIARDDDGVLVVVVRTCTTGVDLARLSQATANPATEPGDVLGEWRLPGGDDLLAAQWPLLGVTRSVDAAKPVRQLSDLNGPMTIDAWAEGEGLYAPGPRDFTNSDLEQLHRGFVLAPNLTTALDDPRAQELPFIIIPNFEAEDCAQYE